MPEGTPVLSWAESGSERQDQAALKQGAALFCFPLRPLLGKVSETEGQRLWDGKQQTGGWKT